MIKQLLNIPFFVRLFLETYFLQALVHVIRLKAFKWTPATEGFATFIAATNVIGLTVLPALTCWFLFKHQHCLGESSFTKLFYPVYKEVRVHRVFALPYTVIFMVKRLLLVLVVIVIDGHGLVQSFTVINLMLICCCYDWAVKPLRSPVLNYYEGLFDAFGLLIAYSLLCYTDFLPSRKAQYGLGWFIYSLLAFTVLGGACYSSGVTFNAIKRDRRIYYRILKQNLLSLRERIKNFFTKMDLIPLESDGNLFIKRETVSVIDIGNEKLESINDIESL